MRGKSQRNKIRRRDAITNWTITLVAVVLSFVVYVATDSRGISRKWITAIMGTVFPFCFVIYAFRSWLLRWSFWVAFAICFSVHSVAVWAFFQYVLAGFQTFSIWFLFPVMLIESLVLLVVIKRIAEKLTGQHETMRLGF